MSGDTKKWMKILFAVALAAPILAAIFSGAGPFAQFNQGVRGFCQPVAKSAVPTLSAATTPAEVSWGFKNGYHWAERSAVDQRIQQGQRPVVIAASEVWEDKDTDLPNPTPHGNLKAYVIDKAVYGVGKDKHGTGTGVNQFPQTCGNETDLPASVAVLTLDDAAAGNANAVVRHIAVEQGTAIAGNTYGGILIVAVSLIPVGLLGVFFFKILGGSVGNTKRRRR